MDPVLSRSEPRFGGFDGLRIFAALAVVFTHCFVLTGYDQDRPSVSIGRFDLAFGSLGVFIFFVTSGFLVTMSWERTGRVRTFARNRFVRIWPALTVLVVFSVVILGPLTTTLDTGAYFRDPLTLKYLGRNLVLVFGPAYRLPGVFTDQPALGVNGSLWTLPYELYEYAALMALGMLGALRRVRIMLLVFLVMLVLFRFGVYTKDIPIHFSQYGFTTDNFVSLGVWFFAGAFLATIRHRIDLTRLIIPGVLAFGLSFVAGEPVLLVIGLATLVIGIGATNLRIFAWLHRFGDPSYGIYIFSFPIQQVLYKLDVARTPWVMLAVAAPLSIAAGYLSWHVVESPALRRFKRPGAKPKATAASAT